MKSKFKILTLRLSVVYLFVSLGLLMLFSANIIHAQGLFLKDKDPGNATMDVYYDSIVEKAMFVLYFNPDSARLIIEKEIAEFDGKINRNIIRLQTVLGASYHIQADYGKALDHYFEALSVASSLNDTTWTGNIYNNIGVVNLKTSNYKDALEYYHRAIRSYENSDQQHSTASTYNNMGLLFDEIKNPEKAKYYFEIALEGFERNSDSIGISAALNNLGMTYSKQNNPDSALYYFNRAAKMSDRNKNIYGLCISWQGKGNLYASMDENKKAIEAYSKSRDFAQQIKQPYQEAYAMLGISKVKADENKTEEALNTAFAAMKIAEQINNRSLTYESHEVLSYIYEKKAEYKKSLEHFRLYSTIKDESLNQVVLHQIYNLELSNLHQTNTLQQLQIQSQKLSISKKNNLFAFTIIVFGLVTLGLYLFFINYRHKNNLRLQETIISLNEKKSRAAIEAEIQERQRMGRELHDGLGQMLSVTRLHISVMQQKKHLPDNRREELMEAAIHSVDEAFDELRNIAHNLAPTLLSEKGLLEALRNLATHINQSNQLIMTIESFGIDNSLDYLLEHTLFRAIQELLSNTIKHAHASNFTVQLIKSEKEITLMAEDNGYGFKPEGYEMLTNGGISNIRSRVENLNGTIFIDSLPGRGTITTIVIPLNKTHEKA